MSVFYHNLKKIPIFFKKEKKTNDNKSCTDVEDRESLSTVGRHVNWYSHGEATWQFLKNLKTELPYDPVILLLGYVSKGIKFSISKGYLHTLVH